MIGLIGKKLGMTQVFSENGEIVPVTVIQAGPCRVIHRKTKEMHGYDSVQLGYEEVDEKKLKKPQTGHFKKHNSPYYKYLREFRLKMYKDIEEGEVFDVSMFVENEILEISGTSKGKGFQGVIKRHNFHGFKATHGVHESYRGPGAIGQCATPSRVFKGKKLPGHTGMEKVSVLNCKVIKVDLEKNLVMVKGAVPGHRNGIVRLRKEL
ncbi:MAG: 50S ribosomal protein L3 [Candidatus Cloacimonetes bacterium]|nr:50S ribosomal protein L3 [Candidatus Cloacimonadota bacterium]MCF7814360.1 50S ribosomal protein L3 [Candidatus Cloacimonadota bacterium]MCF7868948.1 50S ribosomal protein L3 [Candidatus Cloacimonadota bacterium]MCF7884342.1 50S ribosomal protein L3 [Candidatus Cloacimonadota bacterium]